MLNYVLFIIGFIALIKGADLLVDGASSIARRFKISDMVIGLTIVAFGTSTPELFVNITASIKGNTDIAIGNVLGSNIANIFLILGISSLIYPLSVTKGTVWKEIPFSLMAALLLGVLANDQIIDKSNYSTLTRIDGIVFLLFFIIFTYYVFGIAKNSIEGLEDQIPGRQHGIIKSIMYIIIGFIGLGVGGKLIVDGAVRIAVVFGLSQSVIGLTIVAIGTSLPELATSAIAAYKKNVEIAVGNVVGSNIFNILFVLGISSTIKELPFQKSNNIDILIVIIASLLLFICMFTGKKRVLDRWEGAVFIILYFCYISFILIV